MSDDLILANSTSCLELEMCPLTRTMNEFTHGLSTIIERLLVLQLPPLFQSFTESSDKIERSGKVFKASTAGSIV